MELKILNSILFTHLRPWLIDSAIKKILTTNIKGIATNAPVSNSDFETQITALLSYDTEMTNWVKRNSKITFDEIFTKQNTIIIPNYSDAISKFYFTLITVESERLFQRHCNYIATLTKKVDIVYNTNLALKSTKALLLNTVQKIKEMELSFQVTEQSSLTEYVLGLLRISLTELFLNIQAFGNDNLKNTISIEDLYLIDLELPISLVSEVNTIQLEAGNKPINQDWICFGYKDDISKLITVINQLCTQIELLNTDISSADDMINALTTKKLLPGAYTIKLGCETKMFRYIIDKFSIYFTDLTLANIEKSAIFYSNQDKKNKPITQGNLSSSKKGVVEPKEKTTIDKIFKYLQ